MSHSTYTLLDSGEGKKLEKFGPYVISRPCAAAVWNKQLPKEIWNKADALFSREPANQWSKSPALLEEWKISVEGITFKIKPTDFGHLGIFPEQKTSWKWLQGIIAQAKQHRPCRVLNLFAYSGGSTLAAAKAGAEVCHLDASKGMVAWARENATLSGLSNKPIRWIVDDVHKFLQKEVRRGVKYDGIILDPPSFGRGSKGEVFKIESDIGALLSLCKQVLSSQPLFVLFSCHTPEFSPIVMHHLLQQMMHDEKGTIDYGEMTLSSSESASVMPIPSGTFAKWMCA